MNQADWIKAYSSDRASWQSAEQFAKHLYQANLRLQRQVQQLTSGDDLDQAESLLANCAQEMQDIIDEAITDEPLIKTTGLLIDEINSFLNR